MPNAPKTTAKAARVDDDLWTRAGEAVSRMDTDRSAVIREFLRWYCRYPGAELPQRPGDEPAADPRVEGIKAASNLLDEAGRVLRDVL